MRVFETAMQNAAKILFWVAVILFFATGAAYWFAAHPNPTASDFGSQDIFEPVVILGALSQALNLASWPFTGAAVVWVLNERAKRGAE